MSEKMPLNPCFGLLYSSGTILGIIREDPRGKCMSIFTEVHLPKLSCLSKFRSVVQYCATWILFKIPLNACL